MSPSVSAAFPALIAAGASLIVALIAWFASRSNQAKLLENQVQLQRYQRELKHLQTALDEKHAERSARRDYEYEARKRLYHECSPLLFQLADQAASALGRIRGIADAAANGNLGSGTDSWLTSTKLRYYRTSTEYRLLAPLGTLKLLQKRLTRLDLSLDPDTHLAYVLTRQAYRALADDFELARLNDPRLPYDPHHVDAEQLRRQEPGTYWQQGVPIGILDNAVEALLVKDGEDGTRVMSFFEFENLLKSPDKLANTALDRISYLLADFHPQDRPVLWRVLLVTASIYRAVTTFAEREPSRSSLSDAKQLLLIPTEERIRFGWAPRDSQDADKAAQAEAFAAVDTYLVRELQKPIERVMRSWSTDARRE